MTESPLPFFDLLCQPLRGWNEEGYEGKWTPRAPGGRVARETFTLVGHDGGHLLKQTGTGGYLSVAAAGAKVAGGRKVFGVGRSFRVRTVAADREPSGTVEALLHGVPGPGEDG
ncbi:hypothetical protein [Streptomyces sp. NPDC048442]|uniref:hypothetical protein n=1 Tax=Streptomyces sp. NPDC048442 TaxID=3154823 RepID=UPI0034291B0F